MNINKPFFVMFLILIVVVPLLESIQVSIRSHKFLSGSIQNFRKQQLARHNQYRNNHHVRALKLDSQLNNVAQAYAQKLAKSGKFQHSNGTYGQNLYYVWAKPAKAYKNGDATTSWYDQIELYDFENPGFSMETGHFTQVIWKGSKKVGFGLASKDGKDYIVANYDPPGNWEGEYEDNVFQQ